MTLSGAGSVVVRRQLGSRLRRLREAAGKSLGDVQEAGIASKAKLNRIENGKLPVKIPDVWALCRLYGVDQPTTDTLAALAPGTLQVDWWETYSSVVVPDRIGLYVGLEQTATRLRAFDPGMVHGLLQTEDYARAVIASDESLSPTLVDQRLAFRLDRQERTFRRSPEVRVILGAGALALVVGSPDVMAGQVEHLRDLSRDGRVRVSVLPWTVGAYPNRGNFAVLDFATEDDPSVAYVEFPMGSRYVELPEQVAEYERLFATLSAKATPIEEYRND